MTCAYIVYFIVYILSCFRGATTVWDWPLCVDVSEKTFETLVSIITEYWDTVDGKCMTPFNDTK